MKKITYKAKPVVIEAIQFLGKDSVDDMYRTWGMAFGMRCVFDLDKGDFFIQSLEGDMHVSERDFVIKGTIGEFYPCKPHVFFQKYDEFAEPVAAPPPPKEKPTFDEIIGDC